MSQHPPVNFDALDGERILKEYKVTSSFTSCFISPNASCPVCHEKVFFYQNALGSRVFFDELGWPWPKHPCTDGQSNLEQPNLFSPKLLKRRANGQIGEIVEALRLVRRDPRIEFHSKYQSSPWWLFVVLENKRIGFQNNLKVRSLVSLGDETITITFISAKEIPQPDDIISFNGQHVSVFNAELLRSKEYQAKSDDEEYLNNVIPGGRDKSDFEKMREIEQAKTKTDQEKKIWDEIGRQKNSKLITRKEYEAQKKASRRKLPNKKERKSSSIVGTPQTRKKARAKKATNLKASRKSKFLMN